MSPVWRKSSHSHDENSDCVELARLPSGLGIRDSKIPRAGHLDISREDVTFLLARVKGERDAL
ncbi:DUF397 domain-containing protein [Spirillospora sp. NPDC052269]